MICIINEKRLFCIKRRDNRSANKATNVNITMACAIKSNPSISNSPAGFSVAGLTNWGKNAIKNNNTFGFRIFIRIPLRYSLYSTPATVGKASEFSFRWI